METFLLKDMQIKEEIDKSLSKLEAKHNIKVCYMWHNKYTRCILCK